MLLTLSVISAQGAALGSSAYRVFDAQGGTIGRIEANDWVLPDPAKFVSSHHARIKCHNNVFYLQDISTNGTFINSTDSPVSKTDLTALGDGDRILIGDYEILVQLIDDGAAVVPAAPLPAAAAAAPPAPAPAPAAAWPLAAPAVPLAEEAGIETADPLLLLGGAAAAAPRAPAPRPDSRPTPPAAPAARAPSSPQAPPVPGAPLVPAPPAAKPTPPTPGAIPDDWALTGFNLPPVPVAPVSPAPSPPVAAPPAAPPRAPERVAAPPQPAAALPPRPAVAPTVNAPPVAPGLSAAATLPSGSRPAPPAAPPRSYAPGTMDERLVALFNGLGVDPDRVSPETFAELGEIVRVVVQGLIDVLQSRSEVKNNFRVPMTTMRPVENNPLKFSMNVEDAIHNLFVKRNPGYLQPVDAFREGFRDIAFHQVAMLAGIRTAFNSMLAGFHPSELEETYERKLKRTMLLGMGHRLKYWDLYCEQFEDYDKDAEATFQNLFGEDFAKAYFDQLQKLATTARARKR